MLRQCVCQGADGVSTSSQRRQPAKGVLSNSRARIAKALNAPARSLGWAGAELGLLAFCANAVMVSITINASKYIHTKSPVNTRH